MDTMKTNNVATLTGEMSDAIAVQRFIQGLSDDKEKQIQILKVYSEQLKVIPFNQADAACKKCYGRGFTGYNSTYNYFNVCPQCFNRKKERK